MAAVNRRALAHDTILEAFSRRWGSWHTIRRKRRGSSRGRTSRQAKGRSAQAELIRWIDGGVGLLEWAFTYKDEREETRYIYFPSFVSLHLICLLRSAGVSVEAVNEATLELRQELGVEWPFASKELWNPYKTISMISDKTRKTEDLKSEWRTPYNFVDLQQRGRPSISVDLEFGEDGVPCAWTPIEGIRIDPRFVSGSPCLARTRIPTWLFPGMVRGEDIVEEVADAYDISKERVEKALDWEKQLADAGI